MEGASQALTHLTGPHHQYLAAFQASEALGGHGHCGLGDRRDVPGDRGIGPDPLSHLEGVAKQRVQNRADRALSSRRFPRAAHLPEDLVLAQHG